MLKTGFGAKKMHQGKAGESWARKEPSCIYDGSEKGVGLGIEKSAKERRVIESLKGLRGKGRRKKEEGRKKE